MYKLFNRQGSSNDSFDSIFNKELDLDIGTY